MRGLYALILCLFLVAAAHADGVAIDFSQPIVDENGKPVPIDPKQESLGVVTLKFAAIHALTGLYDDEKGLQPEKKFERGMLAQKISESDKPIQLTAEQVAMIKQLIGKAYGPWVIAKAWPMLDPAEKK